MFRTDHNEDSDRRGQVGIGTLIVFIAMVLVAAIAAGVLINTAGLLQSTAEESGDQAQSQVTNRLQVVNAVGEGIATKTDADDEVSTVEITVKRAPGADNVDLETVTAQWVSSGGTFNIVSSDSFGGHEGAFQIGSFRDDDDSISGSSVLNDPADRAILTFYTDEAASGDVSEDNERIEVDLSEGTTASIRLNTQAGGETTATLVVPESLSGKSAVTL